MVEIETQREREDGTGGRTLQIQSYIAISRLYVCLAQQIESSVEKET